MKYLITHSLYLIMFISASGEIGAGEKIPSLKELAATKTVVDILLPKKAASVESIVASINKHQTNNNLQFGHNLRSDSTQTQLNYVLKLGFPRIGRKIEKLVEKQQLPIDLQDYVQQTFFRLHFVNLPILSWETNVDITETLESIKEKTNSLRCLCLNALENFHPIIPAASNIGARVELFKNHANANIMCTITTYNDIQKFLAQINSINLDLAFINNFTDQPGSNLLFRWPKHLHMYAAQLNVLEFTHGNKAPLTELPSELQYLVNLTLLRLTNNIIKKIPGNLIAQLKELRTLDLANNKIVAIPDEISTLINLETANFEKNELTMFPEKLYSLPKLTYMNIQYNKMNTFPNHVLNQLSIFYQSPLIYKRSFTISKFPRLRVLLDGNPFFAKKSTTSRLTKPK